MHPQLDILIRSFRAAQDRGVALLRDRLGVAPPGSNREWAISCSENGLHSVKTLHGVQIKAHGYGVELRTHDFVIDFDWGENGEPDGFDGWRLYLHSLEHDTDFECSHQDCIYWLEQAYTDGELSKDGAQFYDPRFRVTSS